MVHLCDVYIVGISHVKIYCSRAFSNSLYANECVFIPYNDNSSLIRAFFSLSIILSVLLTGMLPLRAEPLKVKTCWLPSV